MSAIPGYSDLADALARLGAQEDPAAYHGVLCGALCVHDADEVDAPALLRDAATPEDPSAQSTLREVYGRTAESLAGGEMDFAPLLPDDEDSLSARVQALSDWCGGFLYGLALRPGLDLKDCSPEVREIVRDFTQFTRAAMDADADAETEETAYAELVEYIRVGVQLIFMELHARADATLH